jgi:putative MATE family efflux protein
MAHPTQPAAAGLWAELRQALVGSDIDYTAVPLRRAIFLLAVPMILELAMESTFALVDIYFVAQLGASAVATVGLTETYLFLLYAIGIGLGMAVTAIVARRVGEQRHHEASIAAGQSLLLGLLVSLPLAAGGLLFPRQLLALMGADAWALEQGYRYTQWMLGTNAVILLLFVGNAIFRGAGAAAIAMRVLWIANGVNILLNPLLIFGLGPLPGFGVAGSAIATSIGRGIGVLVLLQALWRGSSPLRVTRAALQLHRDELLAICRTSLGGIGQMIIAMTSWIFLMRLLADIGSAAVAGATITVRLMMFTLLPAQGLANAAATLVGQSLGAGRPDRAEAAVWQVGRYNMGFLLLVSLVYWTCSESLLRLFTSDPAVVAVGAAWLEILSYSYFVYGWWMVSVQAFNGAGDTRTPTLINLVFFWLLQLPLSWWLATVQGWNELGVFWGVFLSETAVGLFTLWLFTRGGWKDVRV